MHTLSYYILGIHNNIEGHNAQVLKVHSENCEYG